jgi:hypothetical protein
MSRDPVGAVCPKCGSDAYAKRGSTRVCQSCSTGYRQPTPFWQRELPGGPYLIPGLLLSLAAGVGLVVVLLTPAWSKLDEKGDLTFVVVGLLGGIELLGIFCWVRGLKMSFGGPSGRSVRRRRAAGGSQGREGAGSHRADATVPFVPPERAVSLVRHRAAEHGASDILDRVGLLQAEDLGGALAWLPPLEDGEVPLIFVSLPRSRQKKAAVLLSNRRLYSSSLDEPIALAEIQEVSAERPLWYEDLSIGQYLAFLVATLVFAILAVVFILYFGRNLRLTAFSITIVSYIYITLKNSVLRGRHDTSKLSRLLVNGRVVYSDPENFNHAFWIGVLRTLARMAREPAESGPVDSEPVAQTPAPEKITQQPGLLASSPPVSAVAGPRSTEVAVLETIPHSPEGEPLAVEYIHDPTWEQIEQSIRGLNQHTHPLIRLWTGVPEESCGLEIIGGNGKYALREVDDGWVYHNPGAGNLEVEVQTSGEGYRCPASSVCTDLTQVLQIARRFCETQTFEESEETA